MTGCVKGSNWFIEVFGQGAALLIEVHLDRMNTHLCRQEEVQSFTPAVWSHCSFRWETVGDKKGNSGGTCIILLNENHSWVVFQQTLMGKRKGRKEKKKGDLKTK